MRMWALLPSGQARHGRESAMFTNAAMTVDPSTKDRFDREFLR